MPKQFKAEKLNLAKQQSARQVELTLKCKLYIQSLAKEIVSSDYTNIGQLMEPVSLWNKVLCTSVETHLAKNIEMKNLMLENSSLFTSYLLECIQKELNNTTKNKLQSSIPFDIVAPGSFSESDLKNTAEYLNS
jgi:hypothetical protein